MEEKREKKESEKSAESESEEGGVWEHWREEVGKLRESIRLDRFAAMRLPRWTRSRAKKACAWGALWVNGQPKKASYQVKAGDCVSLHLPHPKPGPMQAEAIPFEVLHEDRDLVVINKPSGLVCHPGPGHRQGTLMNALLWHFQGRPTIPVARDFGDLPGLVHRLDRETSGVMVIAKTPEAALGLWPQFAEHSIERIYDAFVWGAVQLPSFQIDAPIGRSLRDPLKHDILPLYEGGKDARTTVTRQGIAEGFSWLRCRLETGRTHQIRLHLRSVGHPLIGEGLYLSTPEAESYASSAPPDLKDSLLSFPRHALHASVLAFTHPLHGYRVRFETDLPDDLWRLRLQTSVRG